MARFKNVSGVDLEVSVDGARRLVAAGKEFTVPDQFADRYRQQPVFAEVKATKKEES